MEKELLSLKASDLLNKFGSGGHKPGSGSAAALQGMLSAELLLTVINLTKEPKRAKIYAGCLHRFSEIETALKTRILPSLDTLFQRDAERFGETIDLRERRDATSDLFERQQIIAEVETATVISTELPLEIGNLCGELASFALEVFDSGFKSARGDSGVAINSAISGLVGCISVIELNLLSITDVKCLKRFAKSRTVLKENLALLQAEAVDRLEEQHLQSEKHISFQSELQNLAKSLRGKKFIKNEEIEKIATELQRSMWLNRNLLWKNSPPENPLEILDAIKALKSLGFLVSRANSLGTILDMGREYEVAGEIDQMKKVVSISKQFSNEVTRFTEAHELGHSLLHTQRILHRDRPLDGSSSGTKGNIQEQQANKFATYFLMPRKFVIRKFQEIFGTDKFQINQESAFALIRDDADALMSRTRDRRGLARFIAGATQIGTRRIYSLAELFGVSTEAMAIRLEELGLVEFPNSHA